MTRDEFKGLVDDLMTAVGACEQATDDTAQREVAVAGDALLVAFDAQAAEVEALRAERGDAFDAEAAMAAGLRSAESALSDATARLAKLERVAEKAGVFSKAMESPIWGHDEGESWCQEHDDLRAALADLDGKGTK